MGPPERRSVDIFPVSVRNLTAVLMGVMGEYRVKRRIVYDDVHPFLACKTSFPHEIMKMLYLQESESSLASKNYSIRRITYHRLENKSCPIIGTFQDREQLSAEEGY